MTNETPITDELFITSAGLTGSILFRQNYFSEAHIVVNQGGTSSGKTFAIEQVLFCLAAENPKHIVTIVGQDIPNLKAGALRDALTIYNSSAILQSKIKSYNKTDRVFEFKNGSSCYPTTGCS
ncbi:hypothetical protein AAFN85_29290 [Mucilaginibacter sp. CAU 1740]|uniref:hypothetical protein n=1 Tax=Mucilaginibacter sp. CAU 1740 TaxID=3140365 RepID=UPI00325A6C4E